MRLQKEPQSAEELLRDDHEALDKLLKVLLAALDKGETSTTLARLDLFWARLAMHIRAEHLHLFPAILRPEQLAQTDRLPLETSAADAVEQLRRDHDFFMHELAASIKIMRTPLKTKDSDADIHLLDEVRARIAAVSKRLESHNEVEEEFIYGFIELRVGLEKNLEKHHADQHA